MQRLANDAIRYKRPLEITGVDVVDAERNRSAQNGQGDSMVLRRPENVLTRKLHRTVAEATEFELRARWGELAA